MENFRTIRINGEDALDELQKLRDQIPATGLYPILIGDEEDIETIEETVDEAFPEDTLQMSSEINITDWLREQRPEEEEEEEDEDEAGGDSDEEWPPSEAGEMSIVTHLDVLTRVPKPLVEILLLKANASWEAFAHLHWGGWNECPPPEVHCAIHQYWQTRYGAEVVSITGDVVQCIVTRPPTNRAEAMALAKEQYAYCSDIVDQGTETIEVLAATLLNGRYWYFWWD